MSTVREEHQMVCPSCGTDDEIDIGATIYVRLYPDGTDVTSAQNGDHEWTDDSTALCCACGHAGTVRDFTTGGRS